MGRKYKSSTLHEVLLFLHCITRYEVTLESNVKIGLESDEMNEGHQNRQVGACERLSFMRE
jgi:hypothetical protein